MTMPNFDFSKRYCVIGLGTTGLSVVRFLTSKNADFAVADTRPQLNLQALRDINPSVACRTGELCADWLSQFDSLIVSPGLSCKLPALQQAESAGAEIIGDVELFCRLANAPIVAVTGSNGKSTVVSLLECVGQFSGKHVVVGGNLGTAVLDLLTAEADLYVLELSSFQLETTLSLRAQAACVLNVSEDHMDRYSGLAAYIEAKQRIYRGATNAVCLQEDVATHPQTAVERGTRVFAEAKSHYASNELGLATHQGQPWIFQGEEPLMPIAEMRLAGRHNQLNACFVWALGLAVGLEREAIRRGLGVFAGLKHRTELLAEVAGVQWINDSKGTNVGATLAAIEGMGRPVVLIAGGDGKGADFSALKLAMQQHGRALITMGRDGPAIAAAVADVVPTHACKDLEHAIEVAKGLAVSGDCVLLSPACASFDMFDNYQARGDVFADAVQRLVC